MPSTATKLLQITVNGARRVTPEGATVADLLNELTLDARKVAIERNLAIVPRSAHTATRLMDGDRIEIVGFIGGG